MRRNGLERYRLRRSPVVVYLRHGTVDLVTFDEIFRRGHYEPPPLARDALASIGPMRVVDLGANVGLFGAYVKRSSPDVRILAVEPLRANLAVLRKTVEANESDGDWSVVEACADVRDGTVPFADLGFATARVEAGPTAQTVPAVDVLPLLEDADLVKIDIEGAEWPILSDPRFARARPPIVALEYHSHGCPAPDPAAYAHELLGAAGYRVEDVDYGLPPGQGMLWASQP